MRTTASNTVHSVAVPLPAVRAAWHSAPTESFTIDCAECMHQHSSVCDDCVVNFIVSREPEDAVVVDVDEARAVRLLQHAGLVPESRHSYRVG